MTTAEQRFYRVLQFWATGVRPDGLVHKVLDARQPMRRLTKTYCGRVIRCSAYWENGYNGARRCESCWRKFTGGV